MDVSLRTHPECLVMPECITLVASTATTLAGARYEWPASILLLDDYGEWERAHRTARKRATRAFHLGYTFKEIERADRVDEIYEINLSAPMRQGRPMSAGYTERPSFSPLPTYPCSRHAIRTYGVEAPDGRLVAYIVVYVCGELAMISQILGHADYMDDGIMFLLVAGTFMRVPLPVKAFYNRHDSGTPGLRWFKERLGFAPERVRWVP